MKFGLGLPAIILYPAVMSRWEPDAPPSVITDVARRADSCYGLPRSDTCDPERWRK
jgi:hypothetical protein